MPTPPLQPLRDGLLVTTADGTPRTLDGTALACPVDGEQITEYHYEHALNGHFNLYLSHHGEEITCKTPEQVRQVTLWTGAEDEE